MSVEFNIVISMVSTTVVTWWRPQKNPGDQAVAEYGSYNDYIGHSKQILSFKLPHIITIIVIIVTHYNNSILIICDKKGTIPNIIQ